MPAVEKKIRKQRAKILREAGTKQMQKFLQSRIGKTEKVLIESENKGHTEHFVEVQILGYQAGEIVEAEIVGVTENKLVA
jgi:threonylcarbamoyladenosine tRNA methylthiotransferase MtaB